MKTTMSVVAVLLLALALAGCSGGDDDGGGGAGGAGGSGASGGGGTGGAGGTGGTGGTGGAGGAAGAGGVCPAAGTWGLASVSCNGQDVTESVHTEGGVSDITLEITQLPDGCRVVATITGPTCTEVDGGTATVDPATGDFVGRTNDGISSCDPAGCTFNANDQPCALGDRAGAGAPEGDLDGDRLIITTPPPEGMCGGFGVETVATYQRR